MRKVILVLSAAAALWIFAVNLFTSNIISPSLQAEKGHLSFSERPLKPGDFYWISGEWSFYPNRFLSSEELAGIDPLYIDTGTSWNHVEEFMGANGYGTYHLRIDTAQGIPHALFIPWVNTAYRLFIDNELRAEVGTVGIQPASHRPGYRPLTVPFTPSGNTAEIILHVSNFSHYSGGMVHPVMIGDMKTIKSLFSLQDAVNSAVIGALVMAAAIAAIFFSSHHKQYRLLYIAASSLILAVRIALGSTMIIYRIFPEFPWQLGIRIEYAVLPAAAFCMIGYVRHTYPGIFSGTYLKTVQMLVIASASLIFLFPVSRLYELLVIYYIIIALLLLFWLVSMVKKRSRNDKPESRADWVFIIFGASVLLDILIAVLPGHFYASMKFSSIALLYFIFIIIFIYSKQFLDSLKYAQELTNDLEEKVKTRTAELESITEELYRLAVKDELTGLWNRNELQKRSEDESYRHNRYYDSKTPYFSVLYIDLDNFKYFNDTFTHEVGDSVLKLFSELLTRSSRKSDSIFRIGGDEFLMFLPRTDGTGAIRIARRILTGTRTYCRIIEKTISERTGKDVYIPKSQQLTCSIGIAVHGYENLNIDRLIQYADTALLQAKISGKDQYHIYQKKDLEHAVPQKS